MKILLGENDYFFMTCGVRIYYGRFIRQTEDGSLCYVLNGGFRVLIDPDGKTRMPNTGETAQVQMIKNARSFRFNPASYQEALSWYVREGRAVQL